MLTMSFLRNTITGNYLTSHVIYDDRTGYYMVGFNEYKGTLFGSIDANLISTQNLPALKKFLADASTIENQPGIIFQRARLAGKINEGDLLMFNDAIVTTVNGSGTWTKEYFKYIECVEVHLP